MKKVICFGILIFGLLMCISETNAYTLTDGISNRADWDGGAFWVDNSFLTFCLEKHEYFNWGFPYNGTINAYAYEGGGGADAQNRDYISNETAYLYIKYLDGGYHNLNPVDADAAAKAFQIAIWKLEDEWTHPLPVDAQGLYAEALNSGFVNNGQVMVLNLYRGDNPLLNPAQSQLIRVSEPTTTPVPEPTTILLLGVGLLGLVTVPRFRKKTI